MTIGTRLFYNRWRRPGRSPDPNAGLDSLPVDSDPNHRHCHGRRQHGHREDRDASRRAHAGPSHVKHLCHRVTQARREPIRLDHNGDGESGTGSSSHGCTVDVGVSRLRLVRNDQLPSTVLQARARLLQRLRSVSPSGSRRNTTALGIPGNGLETGDDFSVTSYGYWEPEVPINWSDYSMALTDYAENFKVRKPPGLSWEAFCSLQQEVFRNAEHSCIVARVLLECCICLERFQEGDGLIKLQCGHQFHSACLEPWLQACGDCPYCRATVVC